MNYLKFFLKTIFGFIIIVALDVMLKKADAGVGDWWFWITLITWICYCFTDYKLTEKDD